MSDSYKPKPGRREIPYWLLAALLIALFVAWSIVAKGDYTQIWRALSAGVLTTLYVTFVAFALACVLGLLLAMARTSASRILRETSTFYIEIVRGVPMLVLLFYIAFVGAPAIIEGYNALVAPLADIGLMPRLKVRDFDLTWRAIFALTIGYSAFIAEIFRAGIEAVNKGQIEAAHALGLGRWHTFRLIVAPQALRTILPPLGNDLVSMVKDSALVSALGVQDITQLGKVYSASTFKFFETYNVVAFIYLVMTISLTLLVRWLEHHLRRSDRR